MKTQQQRVLHRNDIAFRFWGHVYRLGNVETADIEKQANGEYWIHLHYVYIIDKTFQVEEKYIKLHWGGYIRAWLQFNKLVKLLNKCH